MTRLLAVCCVLTLGVILLRAQTGSPTGKPFPSDSRVWTSTDGKKITAEYLGVLDQSVYLKLGSGNVIPCPLDKISEADVKFIKDHPLEYRLSWQAWPVQLPLRMVEVRREPKQDNLFVYSTQKFRFYTNANFSDSLMKDVAQIFEQTYDLHAHSPFGVLAEPVDKYFQAELWARAAEYMSARQKYGSPENLLQPTAGVYLLGPKKFLARLDLMGVKEGSAGWRKKQAGEKDSTVGDYDLSTIVHELTHMLTHDMLNNLPIWMNEGYAEYVGRIPMKNAMFQTDHKNIRAGVIQAMVKDEECRHRPVITSVNGGKNTNTSEKTTKTKPKSLTYTLLSIDSILNINDDQWNNRSSPPVRVGRPGVVEVGPPVTVSSNPDTMMLRYRTAHLIFYYFIEIEGEAGVQKIRRVLDENRKLRAQYEEYVNAFNAYKTEYDKFKSLPGVKELGDGRIQYPANLIPPKAPELGFDPNTMKYKGLEALLDGESSETVGKRIEEALRKDLGLTINFERRDLPSVGGSNRPYGPLPYPPNGPGQPHGPMPVPGN